MWLEFSVKTYKEKSRHTRYDLLMINGLCALLFHDWVFDDIQ